jgi:7-keto-8-aminopelargonate synthetase-like enzyme
MDGDIGPLPALVRLAEKYGAIMMVDDAHASGVLGRNGRGTIDHFQFTAAWIFRSARCRKPLARSAATSAERRI